MDLQSSEVAGAQGGMREKKIGGNGNGNGNGNGTPRALIRPRKDIRPARITFSAGVSVTIITIITIIRVIDMTMIPVKQTTCRLVSLSTCQPVDLSLL